MADNTPQNGTDTIATDDIGGIKFQRVKVVIGADNTNDGDVASANPMPVKPASLAGTMLQAVITVGTTGVALPTSALTNRRVLVIQADPTNTAYLYIGASSVTADDTSTGGFMLSAGQSISLDVANGLSVYARSTAASQRARIIEVS